MQRESIQLGYFSNNFTDKEEEKAFVLHFNSFQSVLAFIVPIIALLWNILNVITEFYEEGLPFGWETAKEIFGIVIFFIFIVTSFIRWWKKLYLWNNWLILIFSLAFLISILIQEWSSFEHNFGCMIFSFLTIGITIQIIFFIISIAKISQYYIQFIMFGITTYLFIKIGQTIKENNSNLSGFVQQQIYLSIILIFNFILAFWLERNAKQLFHLSYEREKQLNNFKDLLQKGVTIPIIVISHSQKKILFANDSAFKFFLKANQNSSQIDIRLTSTINLMTQLKNMNFQIIENENLSNFSSNQQTEEIDFFQQIECRWDEISQGHQKINFVIKLKDISTFSFLQLDTQIIHCDWEGQSSYSICFNDITVYKESDEQKDKILASVSHNLRTPLMCIKAQIENALESRKLDKETSYNLEMARCSTTILLSTINSLLDFSLLNRKLFNIERTWTTLKGVLTDILHCCNFQAKMKNLQFEFKANFDYENIKIFIDECRLSQILMKLLNNAIKHTTNGLVKFTISLKNESIFAFNELEFTIEDTGIGIKKENIESLFKCSFAKNIQNTGESSIGGANIGLYVSNEIAKLIENSENRFGKGIKVLSEYKRGTLFWFTIILGSEDIKLSFVEDNTQIPFLKSKIQKENEPLNYLQNSVFKNKRALIADDDAFCLEIIESFLKEFGFRVIEKARNGIECLNHIESQRKVSFKPFDIILMDCDMPEMNGLEASRKICEKIKEGTLNSMPIFALTANISTADKTTCENAGMPQYLAKPVSKEALRRKLLDLFGVPNSKPSSGNEQMI